MLRNVATVAGAGLERTQETQGNTGFLQEGGAKSGALGAREALLEADLAGWLDACPVALDGEIRRGILAAISDPEGRRCSHAMPIATTKADR